MKRAITFALVLATALGMGVASPANGDADDPGGFWSILPPGQEGNANAFEAASFLAGGTRPPHFDDQSAMYDRLAREYPSLTTERIDDYFKVASFNVPEDQIESIETPKPGVTIVRDTFGVPHIFGDTDRDVVWGAGYVTADDRMFFTDVLRHLGRGRVAEFLGASEANLALDRDVIRVAGYTEEELQFQVDQMPRKFGALGELSVQSFEAFTDGMNAWITEALLDPFKLPAEYPALQLPLMPWKTTDIAAVAVLVQAVFAAGGGGELSNASLRQALAARFPEDPARAELLYRDILEREDPEAPVSTEESFPYLAIPPDVDPASIAIPDAGSVTTEDPLKTLRDSLAEMGIMLPDRQSNWLAVDAEHAEDGKPIGIMGPQTGYFAPEILMEVSMHGPSINTRGATFPGISMAVLLGRGVDFSWSATSGGSDLVDIRVEQLCEPDGAPATLESVHYVLRGQCTPMYQRTDRYLAKPSAASLESDGLPAEPTVVSVDIERTVHGPVFGRATVDGEPVGLSIQRSTWFGEVDSSPAFLLLNTNAVDDAASFHEAMNYVTGSFNWLYVDESEVAFFHSGLYPQRHPRVNPELPTWGTGEWEWQGFLPLERHPHVTLGPDAGTGDGFITSWNNKPARDWMASDSNKGYGPIHRVQSLSELLAERIAAAPDGRLSVVDMIQIMADAATVDLRATQMLPEALDLLAGRPAVADQVALLGSWLSSGAHRVDVDQDGRYEHEAAVALLDEWYNPMLDAVLEEFAGLSVGGRDDGNRRGHVGSAFQGGWYQWLDKALRQALGQTPASPLDEVACGDGSSASCAELLEASLLDAVASLGERYGEDPASWRVPKQSEDIRYSAVGIVTIDPIDWQNRPTFQQVVQVQRARAS